MSLHVCEHDEVTIKEIGLKHKLYINRYDYTLKEWLKNRKIIRGKIAYDKDKPIGIAVLIECKSYERYNFGVYVLPKYRNKGIGSKLVSDFSDIYVCASTPKQKKFWKKHETICNLG